MCLNREAQPEGRTLAAGGEAPAGGGARRPPEIKGVANALKPVELTVSIQAHEMTAWREQWVEYRDNSAFSNFGERSILAYLKQCVSREILIVVNYKEKNTEDELLQAIQEYLDTKVHPKVIRQLEIWRARQSDGSTVTESMSRQVCAFYDSNMEGNTPEDWLKLLLYATCTDKEILTKILTKTRDLDTPHQIIDFVDAEECGKNNANRLLGCNIFASKKTISIVFTTFFSIHKVNNLMWSIQITSLCEDFCQNFLVSTYSIQEEFEPIL